MSAADLKGDAIAVFSDHRDLILGLAGAAVVLLLLFAVLGGRLLGGMMFVGYNLLWLAVVAFVLWMLYRLVIAVERIAGAQERIASAQFQAELDEEPTSRKSATEATFGDERTESANTEFSDENR